MTERALGISTRSATDYVAAFTAAESADGQIRQVQLIGLTAGKIDATVGAAGRIVSSNDAMDITTLSGNTLINDSHYLAIYVQHTQPNGSCLVTPLLCDSTGRVMGSLESKVARVTLPLASGTNYIANCLVWPVLETGAWTVFSHVSNLSSNNTVSVWVFTF